MKTNKLIICLTLLFSSTFVNVYCYNSYPLPEGAEVIPPCTKEEVVDFFRNLKKNGINNCAIEKTDRGQQVSWYQEYDEEEYGGYDTTIVISENGSIEGQFVKSHIHRLNRDKLRDRNFYFLTFEHYGTGRFGGILSCWLEKDKIDKNSQSELVPINIHPDVPFPDYIADPFLIMHEGKIYLRVMEGYCGWGGLGIDSLKTYQLQGTNCTLEKALSINALPPERLNLPYFKTLQKVQKLPKGFQSVEPCQKCEIDHFTTIWSKNGVRESAD